MLYWLSQAFAERAKLRERRAPKRALFTYPLPAPAASR